ncbi:MAG TPA: hypothetical protein VK524_22325 [Polyangiaceae bacterium]|nr:hypothetical protein [Polyangiaceae bacterium]
MAEIGGAALVRGEGRERVVVVYGDPEVALQPLQRIVADATVVAPAFSLRCELAPSDASAWIQLTAAPE